MHARIGILGTLTLIACGGGGEAAGPPPPPPPVAVASVSVEPVSATLAPGATQALSATPRDVSGNPLTGRTITWASANTSIATVSTTGVVTAVAPGGPVAITATSEGRSGTAQVTVLTPVASVNVSPPTSALLPGATVALAAAVLDASGATLSGRTVTWATSNSAIVTVSTSGVVTAVSPGGPVTITATSEGRSGTAQVTVLVPVASVGVSPATSTLFPGNAVTLSAAVLDASGAALSGRTVTWATSNSTIATVSTSGVVTAVSPGGPVTITATSEGRSGTAQVTVLAPVASVTVTPNAITLLPGGGQQLVATPRDAAGNALTGRTLTWTSNNPAVVTVSPSGLVSAVAPGLAVITATAEGQSGTASVAVLPPVTSVIITGSARVKVGDTYTYTATARLADGTVVVRPLTWVSPDASRATITSAGVLQPLRAGAFTIRAVIDGVAWDVTSTAYDWRAFGSGTTLGLELPADNTITNKFGTSTYAEVVVGCTSGQLLVYVNTNVFVTSSGGVAYNFDGGTVFSGTWVESTDFSSLIFPSLSNSTTLSFINLIGIARTFGFAFTEFNAGAKASIFRVGGLTPLVSAMLPGCALLNNRVHTTPDLAAVNALQIAAGKPPIVSTEAAARMAAGAQAIAPALVAPSTAPPSRSAIRRPR